MLPRGDSGTARPTESQEESTYEYPAPVDAVLSTYTLVVLPEYDRVIERAYGALKDGR